MMHLDRFEAIHLKTPWAPKNLIDRAQGAVETLFKKGKEKLESFKLEVFSSEEEAFLQLILCLIHEKALSEGKNHLLVLDNLRAPFKGILAKFAPLGLHIDTISLDKEGCVDLEQLKKSFYPTTMGFLMEPVDLITGVEQPLEKILETCGALTPVFLVSKSFFGIPALSRKVEAIQFDSALFVQKTYPISGSKDPDKIFAVATQLQEDFAKRVEEGMQLLYLRRFFERTIESMGGEIFFKTAKRDPGTVVFGFPGIHGELLAYWLCQKGIFVSIGGGGRLSLHRYLSSIGWEDSQSFTAVHVSFTPDLEESHLQEVLHAIEECLRISKRSSGRS
jgi:cysteine desulfurase